MLLKIQASPRQITGLVFARVFPLYYTFQPIRLQFVENGCFSSKTIKKRKFAQFKICLPSMRANGAEKTQGRICPCEQYYITYALEMLSTRAGE